MIDSNESIPTMVPNVSENDLWNNESDGSNIKYLKDVNLELRHNSDDVDLDGSNTSKLSEKLATILDNSRFNSTRVEKNEIAAQRLLSNSPTTKVAETTKMVGAIPNLNSPGIGMITSPYPAVSPQSSTDGNSSNVGRNSNTTTTGNSIPNQSGKTPSSKGRITPLIEAAKAMEDANCGCIPGFLDKAHRGPTPMQKEPNSLHKETFGSQQGLQKDPDSFQKEPNLFKDSLDRSGRVEDTPSTTSTMQPEPINRNVVLPGSTCSGTTTIGGSSGSTAPAPDEVTLLPPGKEQGTNSLDTKTVSKGESLQSKGDQSSRGRSASRAASLDTDKTESDDELLIPRKCRPDWILLQAEICRNFDSARIGAKIFLLITLRKIRDFQLKHVRHRELEEGMALLYRALEEESQLLAHLYGEPKPGSTPTMRQHEIAVMLYALTNLQEATLTWKSRIMEAYALASEGINSEYGSPEKPGKRKSQLPSHNYPSISFTQLSNFLDESIAVLEALYWKKKALGEK